MEQQAGGRGNRASGTHRETITPLAGNAARSVHGCYLLVLERGSGGEWLIGSQVWSEAD